MMEMARKTPTSAPFSGGFDLRHRLKLTQEGKDEDLWYVTHLSISPNHEVFAAGGPQGSIKLFKMDTLLYCGDFKAHSKKITGLEFCHINDHCFWTSSADSTLSYWDTRTSFNTPVYRILSSNNCPFTACGLNCSDETVAAATEPYGEDVCLYLCSSTKMSLGAGALMLMEPGMGSSGWKMVSMTTLRAATTNSTVTDAVRDTRQFNAEKLLQRNTGLFTDCHNCEITQIEFSPVKTHQMVSGSFDGLICVLDVSKGSEDDCLESVLNTGSSVSQIGFYGQTFNSLHCLTHIETLQLWNIAESSMVTDFKNPREENGSGEEMGYFIDCAYHPLKDELFFMGGTQSGRLHIFRVKDSELEPVCPLMGGHTAIVRCLAFDSKSETFLTGGEDSIISCWKPKDAENSKTGKDTRFETSAARKSKYFTLTSKICFIKIKGFVCNLVKRSLLKAVSGAMERLKVRSNKPYDKP